MDRNAWLLVIVFAISQVLEKVTAKTKSIR